jgi:hypothetical protein
VRGNKDKEAKEGHQRDRRAQRHHEDRRAQRGDRERHQEDRREQRGDRSRPQGHRDPAMPVSTVPTDGTIDLPCAVCGLPNAHSYLHSAPEPRAHSSKAEARAERGCHVGEILHVRRLSYR